MKEIRTLVLCSTRFAGPSIHQLLQAGMLAAVAVPAGNDECAEYAEAVVRESRVPVIRVNGHSPEKELLQIIGGHRINLGIILTFSWKISAPVFTVPALGFYNFHPGPLPLYRGPDPIFQQIKRREDFAGITLHRLDENFDSGPIVMQEKIKISSADTYGLLMTKLAHTAVKMLGVLLKMLVMDIVPPAKKQDDGKAAYYQRQSAADVWIRWNKMTADEIVSLMNACNPWNKGAVTQINNMIVRLPQGKKSVEKPPSKSAPGTIISVAENEIRVAAMAGETVSVAFIHVEEGFLAAGQLSNFNIRPGDVFTDIK